MWARRSGLRDLLLLAAATLLLCSCATHARGPSPRTPLAAKLCANATYMKHSKCGIMTGDEFQATYGGSSPYAGTLNYQMPDVSPAKPLKISDGGTYYVYFKAPIALACQGKTLVRSVFKMVKQPKAEQRCAGIRLRPESDADMKSVVRCLLELPPGGGSEHERATKAKEVKCWRCQQCDANSGCPSVQGAWYSDVFITQAVGCGFNRVDGWDMPMVQMVANPGWAAEVVNFEVCSDPGCFDKAHEEAKLAKALPCNTKTC